METEKTNRNRPFRRSRRQTWKIVLAIILILILLVFLLIPAYVSSRQGQRVILDKINANVEGKTNFSDLSMGWWRGIKITDFSFIDTAGTTDIKIKQIDTKPSYMSILFGNMVFGKTIIDKPQIALKLEQEKEEGKISSETPTAKKESEKKQAGLPIEKIDLVVNDGNLKIYAKAAEPVEFSNINSMVNLRPPGNQTNFSINMAVVEQEKTSTINTQGSVTPPGGGWMFEGTNGNVTIETNDLNLASLLPLLNLAGIEAQGKGIVSANFESTIIDGQLENLDGVISGRDIDLTMPQLKGDRLKTSILNLDAKIQRQKDLLDVKQFNFRTDWATVQATGQLPTTTDALQQFFDPQSKYNLNAVFQLNLAAIASQMPKTIGLKPGTAISSGQIKGDIKTITEGGLRKIDGQANLENLKGTVDGKPVAISAPITAVVQLTSDEAGVIKYDRLDLSAPFAKINGSGTMEALNYDANVDFGKLQGELGQFINIPYKIAGLASSKGQISSVKNKIAATGLASYKNIQLTSDKGATASIPTAEANFTLAVDREKNVLSIASLDVNSTIAQLNIKDSVFPLSTPAKEPLKLDLSANYIDLAGIQPFLVMFASFPQQMQLAGTAQSKINVTSRNETYLFKIDSTKIRNLKVIYPQQQPFVQDEIALTADGQMNTVQKTYTVKWQLVSPQIKIQGNLANTVEDTQTKLDGKANLDYDWTAVSTLAAPFLPQGLHLQGHRNDTVTFASTYPTAQPEKLLANLNSNAKTGFAKADYMGLNFGPTEVAVEVQNGLLKIPPFTSTVNNGQINFAGQADFKRKPTLLETPGPMQIIKDVQINDVVSAKLLQFTNPIFAKALNTSGVASLYCDRLVIPLAGATKNDIVAIGTMSLDNVRMQNANLLSQILSVMGSSNGNQNITIHPTKFALEKGYLRYDDMQIDVGNRPLNFKGVIGLDRSLNMTIVLPVTIQGRSAQDSQSANRVALPLKGTLDSPQLDLGKLLQENIRRQGEEILRKGIEDLFK